MTGEFVRNVVSTLVRRRDERKEGEEKFFYSSDDFNDQNYTVTKDIITGEFIVPARDSSTKKGKVKGYISWQSLAYPPTNGDENFIVHESVVFSRGIDNNAETYHGSACHVARGGFYDTDTEYKFIVHNESVSKDDLLIVIKKVSDKTREVVVKSLKK